MGIEIERKFLLDEEFVNEFIKHKNYNNVITIKQGYILNSQEKVVRVRLTNDKCYITIKGENSGMVRSEFEYEVPKNDAEYLLDNMCSDVIEKNRYIIHNLNDVWEIDVFGGNNTGLTVAEVEIPSEDYDLSLPSWVKQEVTDDARYYNSSLVTTPYKEW